MNRRRIVPHRSPALEITSKAAVFTVASEDSPSDVARALKHYVLHGHERYIKDISPRVQDEITSMSGDAINAHAATRDLTFSSDQIDRIRKKQSLYPRVSEPVVSTERIAIKPKRSVGGPRKKRVHDIAPEPALATFSLRGESKASAAELLFLQAAVEIGFTAARRILDKIAESVGDFGLRS